MPTEGRRLVCAVAWVRERVHRDHLQYGTPWESSDAIFWLAHVSYRKRRRAAR